MRHPVYSTRTFDILYYTAVNYCAKYFINSALVKEQYNIALLSVVENFTRILTMEV